MDVLMPVQCPKFWGLAYRGISEYKNTPEKDNFLDKQKLHTCDIFGIKGPSKLRAFDLSHG